MIVDCIIALHRAEFTGLKVCYSSILPLLHRFISPVFCSLQCRIYKRKKEAAEFKIKDMEEQRGAVTDKIETIQNPQVIQE